MEFKRAITIAALLAVMSVARADVCVFVADESGKTIYVGQFKAVLKITTPESKEESTVKLRSVEIESGHHESDLDHGGQILVSEVEGKPTLRAEVVVIDSALDIEALTTSHFRGKGELKGAWQAVLEVEMKGGTRVFQRLPQESPDIEEGAGEESADEGAGEEGAKTEPAKALHHTSSYPLSVCLISDEPFTDTDDLPVRLEREGRIILSCCKMCTKELDKSVAAVVKRLDEAIVAAQMSSYPLDVCPISEEPLGDKSAATTLVLPGNRLVLLCCGKCASKASESTDAIVKRLDEAIVTAQGEDYPTEACIVCDGELKADSIDAIHGTRLVRVCCTGCLAKFERDVEGYIANLDTRATER